MECSYAVSTLEATAVSMSVVCHLKASLSGAKDTNLILAKGNLLEVYSFSELGLVKVFTTSVFGRITALDKYQPGDHAYDALFILTERKHFCILSYDENNNTLITRAKGNLKDQVGRSLEQGQRGALDPEGRMIGMMLYEGLLKVCLSQFHLSS